MTTLVETPSLKERAVTRFVAKQEAERQRRDAELRQKRAQAEDAQRNVIHNFLRKYFEVEPGVVSFVRDGDDVPTAAFTVVDGLKFTTDAYPDGSGCYRATVSLPCPDCQRFSWTSSVLPTAHGPQPIDILGAYLTNRTDDQVRCFECRDGDGGAEE